MVDSLLIPERIGSFKFRSFIASGNYGAVWKATHTVLNIDVAIKVVPKIALESDDSRMRFVREVTLLQRMDHPFISSLFQILEDDLNHYLVLEYVPGGNFLNLIEECGCPNEGLARYYFAQLIAVLDYLHSEQEVAHRDLKAENIVIDKYGNIRVIDFGFAHSFSDQSFSPICGSAAYISPEVIKEMRHTGAVDVWSAGVLLYLVSFGRLPFNDDSQGMLFHKIVYADPVIPESAPPLLADLIRKMLTKEPEKRITLAKIKEHAWFSRNGYLALQRIVKAKGDTPGADGGIDMTIVQQMEGLGLSSPYLKSQLFSKRSTDMTAAYRILARERMTEQLHLLLERMRVHRACSMNLGVVLSGAESSNWGHTWQGQKAAFESPQPQSRAFRRGQSDAASPM
jgi:serine/threonine protein kinase